MCVDSHGISTVPTGAVHYQGHHLLRSEIVGEVVLPCTQTLSKVDAKRSGERRKQEKEKYEKRCISTTNCWSEFLVFLTPKEHI